MNKKNKHIDKNHILILIIILVILSLFFKPINNFLSFDKNLETPIAEYHNDVVRYWAMELSIKYNIPHGIIESILYQETQFTKNNPEYNAHRVGDSGKSFGPGQVQVPTAKGVWRDSDIVITSKKLKEDIQFNIETSIKFIKLLHDKYRPMYKDDKRLWLAVFTCYNSGEGSFEKNGRKFNNYAFEVYNRYIDIEKMKYD